MSQNFTSINHLIAQSQQPVAVKPVSHPKEAEPIGPKREQLQVQEMVEHEIQDEEVKNHTEIRPDTIKLPPDLQKIGVQANQTTKFPTGITLPLSDDKIVQGLKAPYTTSLHWFAALCLYLLRQTHFTLKKVGGHVVRVAKR